MPRESRNIPVGVNPNLLKGANEEADRVKRENRARSARLSFDRGGVGMQNEAARAGNLASYGQTRYMGQDGSDIRRRYMGLYGDLRNAPNPATQTLRQGLDSNISAQRALSAGASPSMGASGARMALRNIAGLRGGHSGDQRLADMADREMRYGQRMQGLSEYGNYLDQLRRQDAQASLGARGLAQRGYGGYENAAYGRYGMEAREDQQDAERGMGAMQGMASMIGLVSDRRKKKRVKSAKGDSDSLLRSLKAYRYEYKDDANGKGEQFGIMAQDLEKSRAGRAAVVDTPEGKFVDTRKLTTALAAAAARLNERLEKLERRA